MAMKDSSDIKKENKDSNIDNIEEISKEDVVVIKKDGFNLLEVILIMFITLFFGGLLGSSLTYAINKDDNSVNKTSVPVELREFISTYKDILNTYYEEIDSNDLLNAGIEGMIEFLGDKYSIYMDQTESESFTQEVDGNYVGIGTEIMINYIDNDPKNFEITVTDAFTYGPAYEAGIRNEDVIIKIDDVSIEGLSIKDVSTKLKGKVNTTVKVTVRRGTEQLDFNVVRRNIQIQSVSSEMKVHNNKNVGYIKIDTFAANTTNQFEKELIKLEDQKIDSLIIDVRDNSGGYLTTVTSIASMFLDKSKVIYQLDTKGIIEKVYSNTSKFRNYPVVVLINENSASASEILAGCMMESYGASIVGVNSLGKGTVQKAYQLSNGATVKYTIQKWLTPNGNWIHEIGIKPTVYVEEDYKTIVDEQLNAALAEITK